MKANDIITIITTITLTIILGLGIADNRRERERAITAKMEGGHWMEDTTERLDSIQVTLDRVIADTIEVAREVDEMAARMDRGGL